MTHSELELQLDAYLDGELASSDARVLESHLKDCGDCAKTRDVRVALGAAIRAELPALQAPDVLRTRVRSALRAGGQSPVSSRQRPALGWRWMALAASLVLVALGSWQLASNRSAG